MYLLCMLFYIDFIVKGGFLQGWIVFYWVWWVIYVIQMSIFFVCIFCGCIVCELCFGMVLGLIVLIWILWIVFGSNILLLIDKNIINILNLIEQYGVVCVIIEIWVVLLFSIVIMWGFFIFCFIVIVMLVNVCFYILVMFICCEVCDGEELFLLVCIGWLILVGIIGIVLLVFGGLKLI